MSPLTSGEVERKSSDKSRPARFVRSLGPYQSLALLLVPTGVVEPLKLVAVAVAGKGHWITGTVMVAVAYAASLLLVERLFRLVKPKLLTLPWFARLWAWFVGLRGKLAAWPLPPPMPRPDMKREGK
jgi:hypothetical protein